MKRPPGRFPVTYWTDPELSIVGPLYDAIRSAKASAVLARIRCPQCGSKDNLLAEVLDSDMGPLFRAARIYSHRDPRNKLNGPDPVLMVHPELPGDVVESARSVFEKVWTKRGWKLAPPGSQAPATWRPNIGFVVQDLLKHLPEADHPTLRVKCRHGHGEAVVDRALLVSELERATRLPAEIPLHAVRVP
jgi:hypothetical protein